MSKTATDNRVLTALASQLDTQGGGFVPDSALNSSASWSHLPVAGLVAFIGAFVTTAGLGSENGLVSLIGVSMVVSAIAYGGFAVTRQRLTTRVLGTAHVVNASPPPGGTTHGRCQLHLVVQAPRLGATAVRHRDPAVPVAKWPMPGGTLPVTVDPRNPRDLRVLWRAVRAHGEPDDVVADDPDAPADQTLDVPAPDPDLALLAEAVGVTAVRTPVREPVPPPSGDSDDGPSRGELQLVRVSDRRPTGRSPMVLDDPLLEEYGSPIRDVGVTLTVSDLKTSLEFYRDALGLFEIESGDDMALLEARTGRLVLRQREDVEVRSPCLMHLTLEVDDVDTARRTLTKRGVTFTEEPRALLHGESLEFWAVSFSDPDGHGVVLTSWRSREETESS